MNSELLLVVDDRWSHVSNFVIIKDETIIKFVEEADHGATARIKSQLTKKKKASDNDIH